jgi:hypothetical protein
MPNCNLIVVDNFYNEPDKVRKYVLTLPFNVTGNYPGKRTKSYATDELKNFIQTYIQPFGGKITDFKMKDDDYNGSFQYTTSRDRSWIHVDPHNNWGGVLFLTPDAPASSGTGFYRFKETKKMYQETEHTDTTSKYSQDYTKWEQVDTIGNVYNRLVLFNSKRFHVSMDYFGIKPDDSRLFQVFFFSTEK